MSHRQQMINAITKAVGKRGLFWAGLRADDAEPLGDLPQYEGNFSILGGRRARATVKELRYEDLSGIRVDVDAWDIGDHPEEDATTAFRAALLDALSRPSLLVTYRPSPFLSSVLFSRHEHSTGLGNPGELQSAFEHKPWVEVSIGSLGVPRVPWTYVAHEERHLVAHLLDQMPVLVRTARSSGGAGFAVAHSADQVEQAWISDPSGFVAVAPLLSEILPINVGGTVWHDGVTLGHASIQIIGVQELTSRPFGYCGNDFGLMAEVDRSIVRQVEEHSLAVGHWLRGFGYLGAFGVDFLVHEGTPLFAEVNPRFQGSTHLSARLDIEAGRSCLYLDHIGAHLGFDAPTRPGLSQLAESVPSIGHFIVHWQGPRQGGLDPRPLLDAIGARHPIRDADVLIRPELEAEQGAVLLRATVETGLTRDGFSVESVLRSSLRGGLDALLDPVRAIAPIKRE